MWRLAAAGVREPRGRPLSDCSACCGRITGVGWTRERAAGADRATVVDASDAGNREGLFAAASEAEKGRAGGGVLPIDVGSAAWGTSWRARGAMAVASAIVQGPWRGQQPQACWALVCSYNHGTNWPPPRLIASPRHKACRPPTSSSSSPQTLGMPASRTSRTVSPSPCASSSSPSASPAPPSPANLPRSFSSTMVHLLSRPFCAPR